MGPARIALTAAAMALALSGGLAADVGPISAQESSEGDAVSEFRGCVAGAGSGDVLFLLDQSASLETTDPDGARVTGAVELANQLAQQAEQDGVDLSLAVAGFDVNYVERSGWESVQSGSASQTTAALESMRDRDTGFETDYWNALEGARQTLRDRAADLGRQQPCQAIVWFTDGEFMVDVRDTEQERRDYGTQKAYAPGVDLTSPEAAEAATAAAEDSLCRSGGLADQLRDSGIRMFSVGLQGPDSTAADFGFMESIATGSGPSGGTCGAILGPANGTFTLASNINDLIFAFDFGGTVIMDPVCREPGCLEGRHVVVVDESIASVRILAASDLPDAVIYLQPPAASELALRPNDDGEQSVAGTDIAWRWVTPTMAEILLAPEDLDAAGWSGVWWITFVDPSAPPGSLTKTSIDVRGDLMPALLDAESITWQVGSTVSDLQFGLLRRGTEEVVAPESVVSTITFTTALEPSGQPPIPVLEASGASVLDSPASVDLAGVQPGQAALNMQLNLTTKAARAADGTPYPGTALEPEIVQLPIELLPPANFPTVGNAVDFGVAEGIGPLNADLPITGPGCVWLEGQSLSTRPDGVGEVSVTTQSAAGPESCIEVGEGDTGVLPLALTVEQAGNGAVTGSLQIITRPLDQPEVSQEQAVYFSADLRKPLNTAVRNSAFWVLGLLGTVVPLGLLWLMAWWQARIPGPSLTGYAVGVDMRDGQLIRSDDGTGVTLSFSDGQMVGIPENGAKTVPTPFGFTLAATASNPLDPRVEIQPAGQDVATSSGGSHLPLVLKDTWAYLRDRQSGRVQLVIFTAITASDQDRDKVLYDAQGSAPRIFARWPEPQTVGGAGGGASVWGEGTDATVTDWGPGGDPTATDWGPGTGSTWGQDVPPPPTGGEPSGKRRWRRDKGPKDPAHGQPPADTGRGDPDWGEDGWNPGGGQPPKW